MSELNARLNASILSETVKFWCDWAGFRVQGSKQLPWNKYFKTKSYFDTSGHFVRLRVSVFGCLRFVQADFLRGRFRNDRVLENIKVWQLFSNVSAGGTSAGLPALAPACSTPLLFEHSDSQPTTCPVWLLEANTFNHSSQKYSIAKIKSLSRAF